MSVLELEKRAIAYLKSFEPEDEPYYLCYSGGKDSDCIRILAQLAGVRHEIHHNLTTVDAPETVQYVKSIPGVHIDHSYYPDGTRKTMWNLIVNNGIPPTQIIRYCCRELKEHGGKGHMKITGVRWAESIKRSKNTGFVKIVGKPKTVQKKAEADGIDHRVTKIGGLILNHDNAESRRFVEHCYRTTSTMLNPIVDWTDSDVWRFIRHYGCESNPLYHCGKKRIGCIGCPMQSKEGRMREFRLYPKYKLAYIRAFEKMLKSRNFKGNTNQCIKWETGKDVYNWWIGIDPNQLSFFPDED